MTGSWPIDPRRVDEWTRNWLALFSSAMQSASVMAPYTLPADAFAPIIDAIRARLHGRQRTLRVGDRDIKFVLVDVTIDGSELLRSVGQYGEVHLTARDVEWDGGRVERLAIHAHNVHVRPGTSPVLVAAPIKLEAHLTQAQLSAWCARLAPRLRLRFNDDVPQFQLAGRVPWARLDVSLLASCQAVRVVPRAVRLGSCRIGLRLPGHSIPVRWLPPDHLLTEIEVNTSEIILRGLRTEWQLPVTTSDIQKLVASFYGGSDPGSP